MKLTALYIYLFSITATTTAIPTSDPPFAESGLCGEITPTADELPNLNLRPNQRCAKFNSVIVKKAIIKQGCLCKFYRDDKCTAKVVTIVGPGEKDDIGGRAWDCAFT
ncbi:hypothetical protein P154DRAFT_580439 [Amniculicola lignicola CBS 123094]|uniref:Uncharacterized protein n=1 Tax=Amniculicola lignicola CBS 123094 TaxID=1392246 RepID=A0A6A5W4A3_9PLEO|nr:hypothetical protein P154DRAFT_580439 [Amniculicola lignicola CBS 123094]